jgi:broad specificity phosphatase PhoE
VEWAGRNLSTPFNHRAPIDFIVTSDLKRARATAELLAAQLDISAPHLLEPGLREYDVGTWSGLTRTEIEARWPDALAAFDRGELDAPPGGESRADFDRRVRRSAARVCDLILQRRAHGTLIVTHGGVIRSIARSAGVPEIHIAHLAGYEGRAELGGITDLRPVSLLPRLDRPGGGRRPAAFADEGDADGEQDAL